MVSRQASGCEVADWMLRMKSLAKDVRRRRAAKPVSRKAIGKRPRSNAPAADADDGDAGEGGAPKRKKRRKAASAEEE